MGWTFSYTPEDRETVLERICPRAGWKISNGNTVVFEPHSWCVDGCWGLCTETSPDGIMVERLIGIARVARRGGVGYGEGGLWMEIHGPCEHGCPQSLLNIEPMYEVGTTDERKQWSADFRARSAKELADARMARRAKQSLSVGAVLTLPERWKPNRLRVIEKRGRVVIGVSDEGRRFRITPKVAAAATISA